MIKSRSSVAIHVEMVYDEKVICIEMSKFSMEPMEQKNVLVQHL